MWTVCLITWIPPVCNDASNPVCRFWSAPPTPQARRRAAAASPSESLDEFATITVYLPVATSHEAIHNVALTKQLAVVATHPRDNFATQFKGTTVDARLARDDEAAVRARSGSTPLPISSTGSASRVA